ncbi:hypothetical protein D3C72_1606440 [compost metagenome]
MIVRENFDELKRAKSRLAVQAQTIDSGGAGAVLSGAEIDARQQMLGIDRQPIFANHQSSVAWNTQPVGLSGAFAVGVEPAADNGLYLLRAWGDTPT